MTSTTSSIQSRRSTASDIDTTNPDDHLRVFAGSRIARIIFFWNFVGLAILVIGVLVLSETRAGLTEAQIRILRTQGELVSNLLIETGAVQGDPRPSVNAPAVREVLRRILPPGDGPEGQGPRVRVFNDVGTVIADTDVLYDRLGQGSLAPFEQSDDFAEALRRVANRLEYLRITPWRPTISPEEEQRLALLGQVVAGQRLNERGQRVVTVSAPVQRVHRVLGVVTVETADVERILVAERVGAIPYIVSATVVVILSSILLTLFIASPIKRLASAADRLRATGATRLSLPELSKRKDEIGKLTQSIESMIDALADRIAANERFAADVSHEIKNPLASIRSAVESALVVSDAQRKSQLLGIVAQDVRRLDRLITDIARASRIEAETALGSDSRVNLAALAEDLAKAYAPDPDDAVAARVRFERQGRGPAFVLGQEGALGQVIRNLVDNARSFSPPGGEVTIICATTKGRDGNVVRLIVEDHGPGVPEANLETIFERFYTERPKGVAFGGNSGLGLSIARQIVAAHKGRIHAENIYSEQRDRVLGARFVVELPLAAGRGDTRHGV